MFRGGKLALDSQETVGNRAESGVVVKAAPASPFIMAEADLLLELLIVALDPPAQLGKIDEAIEGDVVRKGGEPVLGRLALAFGPFDQEPLLGSRLRKPLIAMRAPPGQRGSGGSRP